MTFHVRCSRSELISVRFFGFNTALISRTVLQHQHCQRLTPLLRFLLNIKSKSKVSQKAPPEGEAYPGFCTIKQLRRDATGEPGFFLGGGKPLRNVFNLVYCFVVVVVVVVVVAVRKNKKKHTKNGRLSCMAVSRGKVQLGLRGSWLF